MGGRVWLSVSSHQFPSSPLRVPSLRIADEVIIYASSIGFEMNELG
jgi:hypothetical protein